MQALYQAPPLHLHGMQRHFAGGIRGSCLPLSRRPGVTKRRGELSRSIKRSARCDLPPIRAYVEPVSVESAPADNGAAAPSVPDAGSFVASDLDKPALTWGMVLSLLWQQKLRLVGAFVGLVFGTACNVMLPQVNGRLIGAISNPSPTPLQPYLLPLAALYVCEPLATVLFVTCLCGAWERVMAKLRVHVFARMLAQNVDFYDRHKAAELTDVLSTQLGHIESGVTGNVSRDRGLRSICEVLITLVMLFKISPELAPILITVIVGISVRAGLYKKGMIAVFLRNTMAQSQIIAWASETFAAIRTVRHFGGQRRQLAGFSSLVEEARTTANDLHIMKSTSEAWTRGAVYFSLLAVFVLGGKQVQSGVLPVSAIISFVGYTFLLTFAVQGLINSLSDMNNVTSATMRINTLLPPISPPSPSRLTSSTVTPPSPASPQLTSKQRQSNGASHSLSLATHLAHTGSIEFQDVYFSYPQRPDAEVIRGVSLRLPAGSVTAFVGASGAGKSTMVQLLSQFYKPSSGRITLAGIDISEFSEREWTQSVSVVNQEPVLFAMSVRDNIAYGRPNDDVSDEDILSAAKAANAHEFIENLPQGYDTMVGERGSLLSGGQRQRLAIARALLKDSPIIILDEATSALDSVSERLVQDALERLMKGRTTIVIAHRLSTVQAANNIVVMSEGQIIEQGSHRSLVDADGAYAVLVNSQHLTFE